MNNSDVIVAEIAHVKESVKHVQEDVKQQREDFLRHKDSMQKLVDRVEGKLDEHNGILTKIQVSIATFLQRLELQAKPGESASCLLTQKTIRELQSEVTSLKENRSKDKKNTYFTISIAVIVTGLIVTKAPWLFDEVAGWAIKIIAMMKLI